MIGNIYTGGGCSDTIGAIQYVHRYFAASWRRMGNRMQGGQGKAVCGRRFHKGYWRNGDCQLHGMHRIFDQLLIFLQLHRFVLIFAAFFVAFVQCGLRALRAFFYLATSQPCIYQLSHAIVHVESGAGRGAHV